MTMKAASVTKLIWLSSCHRTMSSLGRAPRYMRHMATSSLISSFVASGPSSCVLASQHRLTSRALQLAFMGSSSASLSGTRFMTSMPESHTQVQDVYQHQIVSISDAYDSGNGEFVSAEVVSDEQDCDIRVTVRVKPDPYTDLENKSHYQYFSFRSTLHLTSPQIQPLIQKSKKDKKSKIRVQYILQNAGQASFANAFRGYSTFVSTKSTPFEPEAWKRVGDTGYDDEKGWLIWNDDFLIENADMRSLSAYFAYFPPFSYERHMGLVARCAASPECSVESLGQTLSGREIEMLTIGTGPRTCWIIHRQHPGESMAEFFAEGLLTRLLSLNDKWDSVAQRAKELYTFYIVPNVNPDGSVNGFLRTNAAGSNLNREWAPSSAPAAGASETSGDDESTTCKVDYEAPTLSRSPEVYNILRRMDQTSCDAFLDIHGDEDLPFNFLAGSQGMPNWNKRLESLHGAFLASYRRANPDMQQEVSYDPDKPNEGMKNICSNQIALRFDCFSGTLEMPFKELWQEEGWGPDRARQLGASVLDPLCYIWPYLRNDTAFWDELPPEDAYVNPSSQYK
eukprot:CCRYP_007620-RB/>CCRYP_007620-RB protein AED:0.03 eAED:0.03 QI:215/1/1/1/0.5/0.4/5/3050/565